MKFGQMACAGLVAVAAWGTLAKAQDAKPEMVENPAYKYWSAYKVGTFVKYEGKTEMTMEGQAMVMTMKSTNKLEELTAEKAVVAQSMSAGMGGGPAGPENTTKQEIPVKIAKDKADLPPGMEDDGTKVTKGKTGTDTVEVKGVKLETQTQEYTVKKEENGQEMEANMKVWTSDKVPGGMVKMEMTAEKPMKMTMKMAVVDYELKK